MVLAVAMLLCAGVLASAASAASKHKVPLFTVVFKGGGTASYSDSSTLINPACSTNGFSTESDTALLKWTVTWKHVVLQRRNFSERGGKSTFHAGVAGDLQSQACDPTTGQLLPVDASRCATAANADGPVTLDVKYFNRGQVGALLPGKRSSAFRFDVAAVDKLKTSTSGQQDCATAFDGDAFAQVGFFTNSLARVNRASKQATQASRVGGDPNPIDCSAPASPVLVDHCTAQIHFRATVTIIRER